MASHDVSVGKTRLWLGIVVSSSQNQAVRPEGYLIFSMADRIFVGPLSLCAGQEFSRVRINRLLCHHVSCVWHKIVTISCATSSSSSATMLPPHSPPAIMSHVFLSFLVSLHNVGFHMLSFGLLLSAHVLSSVTGNLHQLAADLIFQTSACVD